MANILIINRIEEGLFTHTLTADGETQTAIDNAPNLTSFWINGVRVMDFKTKNGAPLVRNQRVLPSEITITDSFGSTPPQTGFTNDVQVWNALGALGYFQGFSGGSGGGGVDSFINLTDVNPNLYLGFEGMVYVVNETATGLEPVIFYNYNNLTQLDDVDIDSLVPSDTGKYVAVSMVEGQPKFTLVELPNSGNEMPNGFTNLGTQSLVDGEYTATIGYEWNYQNIHYGLIDDFTATINPAGEGNSRIDVIHTLPGTNEFTKTEGIVSEGQNTALKPAIPVGALEVTILSIYEDTISEPTEPIIGEEFVTKSSYGWSVKNISGEDQSIVYQNDSNAFELKNNGLISIGGVQIGEENTYDGQPVWILNSTGNSITVLNDAPQVGLIERKPFIFPNGQDMTIAYNGLVRFKRKGNEMLFESYSIGGAGDYIPRSGTIEGQPITGSLKSTLETGFAFDALANIRTQGFSYANTFQGGRFKIGGGTDSPEITAYDSEEAFKTNARIDGTEYFDKAGNPNAHAQMQDVPFVNVKSFGAVGDGISDDTESIQDAIDSMGEQGGTLYFPGEVYLITDELIVNSPILFLGDGSSSYEWIPEYGVNNKGSVIAINSTTKNAIVSNVSGTYFQNIAIVNLSAITPTAGTGIKMLSAGSFNMQNVSIKGFFNNLEIKDGTRWSIQGCNFFFPINYGIYIHSNTDLITADTGDTSISGSNIIIDKSGVTGIRYESSGGLKITNTKINPSNNARVKIAVDAFIKQNTSILLISNSSFEGFNDYGVKITHDTGKAFGQVVLTGNQFYPVANNITGNCVYAEDLDIITIVGNSFNNRAFTNTNSAVKLKDCSNITMFPNTYAYWDNPYELENCTQYNMPLLEDGNQTKNGTLKIFSPTDFFSAQIGGTGGDDFFSLGNYLGVPTIQGFDPDFSPVDIALQTLGGNANFGGNLIVSGTAQIANATASNQAVALNQLGKWGNITVNPSTSPVINIPHGLGGVPDCISIHFSSYGSLELREYSTVLDSTNIIISFNNTPMETSLKVWWSAK